MTGLNDAPTLGDGTLASQSGGTVSGLFGATFADVDAGASLAGVAVIGNSADPVTEGVWEYSPDSGANWFAIGSVADNASALAIDASTQLRFVPSSSFSGAAAPLLVRGLDDSHAGGFASTAAGGVENRVQVDAGANGGTTAIASMPAALSIGFAPVTPPPVDPPVDPPYCRPPR